MSKFFYGQRVLFARSIVTVMPYSRHGEHASLDHVYVKDCVGTYMHVHCKHLKALPGGQL